MEGDRCPVSECYIENRSVFFLKLKDHLLKPVNIFLSGRYLPAFFCCCLLTVKLADLKSGRIVLVTVLAPEKDRTKQLR